MGHQGHRPFGAISSSAAYASGLPAGTVITNTASATYDNGSGSTSVSSNPVSIKVDQLVDVAVTGLDSSPVVASTTPAVLSYSVTNTGNGLDTFALDVSPSVSGNAFDGVISKIVIDNGNGIYEPGIDTEYTAGGTTPTINADGSLKVFVLVSLPSSGADDSDRVRSNSPRPPELEPGHRGPRSLAEALAELMRLLAVLAAMQRL